MNFISKLVKNAEGTQFSINNIPYGVFRRIGSDKASCCTRIGDVVIDLGRLSKYGFIKTNGDYFEKGFLNDFMEKGKKEWDSIRE
jgi:hypothetical protein